MSPVVGVKIPVVFPLSPVEDELGVGLGEGEDGGSGLGDGLGAGSGSPVVAPFIPALNPIKKSRPIASIILLIFSEHSEFITTLIESYKPNPISIKITF